jgi:hypothetical protein
MNFFKEQEVMKKEIGVLAVILLCCVCISARADLITISISGHVTAVDDQYGHLENKIDVNDTFTGAYTYDSAIADSYPEDFSYGQFWNYVAPTGVSLSIGELNFRTDPDNVEFAVTINNNHLGEDSYSIWSAQNLSLSNGTLVQSISWYINDATGTALSSDALPLTAPDLSKWSSNVLRIFHDRDFEISAIVTSAVLIPEPATLFLMMLGITVIRKYNRLNN